MIVLPKNETLCLFQVRGVDHLTIDLQRARTRVCSEGRDHGAGVG